MLLLSVLSMLVVRRHRFLLCSISLSVTAVEAAAAAVAAPTRGVFFRWAFEGIFWGCDFLLPSRGDAAAAAAAVGRLALLRLLLRIARAEVWLVSSILFLRFLTESKGNGNMQKRIFVFFNDFV